MRSAPPCKSGNSVNPGCPGNSLALIGYRRAKLLTNPLHISHSSFRVAVLLACLQCALGARILAFLPLPAKSHHFAFWPILRELAVKGHQVDYLTAMPMPDPPKNLTHILIKDLLADLHGKMDMMEIMSLTASAHTNLMYDISLSIANKLFEEEPEMTKLVNSNEKYDLVILCTYFGQEYSTAFCHKFKSACVSFIPLFDSTWVNEIAGLPDNPSYMIDFKAVTTDRMNFFERLRNMYIWTATTLLSYYHTINHEQELADKYIRYPGWETRPSVLQLSRDLDLILVNGHVSLGYPFPKAPHVKEVGGMNLAPIKPLPKDLQEFMDSATDGVIYFSYGSNVDLSQIFDDSQIEAIINVFRGLKQKVLWKWKGSEIPKPTNAPNLRIQEWFPQQDILAHKNTKVFITHGGLMSLIEAIHHGVPLIGTAVFGDQPKNLRFVEQAGIGIQLKYHNLTDHSLSWSIKEILSNPRYKENMKKRSELFKDRPMSPTEEGVYWIEYVLRHGKVLQPASARMPVYQVYLLDVIATILLSILLGLWIIKKALRGVCSLLCGKKENVSKSKKRQ